MIGMVTEEMDRRRLEHLITDSALLLLEYLYPIRKTKFLLGISSKPTGRVLIQRKHFFPINYH